MLVWHYWGRDGWIWNARAEAGMGTALTIMGNPALQNSSQVALRQWNHKIETLPAERTDDTLTEAVGLRTSWRCPKYSQSQVSNRFIELR
jgi:hypothetical protein